MGHRLSQSASWQRARVACSSEFIVYVFRLATAHGNRGVMLIGNLNLTTHRLLFHAVLPPDEAYRRPFNPNASTEDQANAATVAASHQADVLQAGPVTIHRSALLGNRRVWMELSAEMVTTYPSADEAGRVRPLRSVLRQSTRGGVRRSLMLQSPLFDGLSLINPTTLAASL